MKRRTVSIDLALTVAAQIAYKLLGFAILALLARGLGPAEFGVLMFALATCELAALGTEFGSSAHLTREVAAAPAEAPRLLGEVLGVRLGLGMVYLVLAAAFALTMPSGHGAAFFAIAVYAGLKELSRSYGAAFFGTRRLVLATAPFASHLAILTGGIWLAVAFGSGLGAVVAVYLAASFWLIAACVGLSRHIGTVRLTLRPWRRVIAASLPLFGLGVLTMVQLRIDVTLLGLMRPYADVANYAASARLFEASQSIVRPLSLVFLPIVTGFAATRAYPQLRRSLARLTTLAFSVGIATALVAAVVADEAIRIVYGAAFAPAADVLRVHFAATPFVFTSLVATFHLTALRREHAALVCGAGCVALNVALDLLLIPSAGAIGAAEATLVAEATLAISLLALAVRTLVRAGAPEPPTVGLAAPLASRTTRASS